MKIKTIVDSLSAMGEPVPRKDLILYVVSIVSMHLSVNITENTNHAQVLHRRLLVIEHCLKQDRFTKQIAYGQYNGTYQFKGQQYPS